MGQEMCLRLQAALQTIYLVLTQKMNSEDVMAIKVVALKNGPYSVTGNLSELELTDADGNRYDLTGKERVSLCRCGASVKKPFCDGTHSKIGFQAAEAAVKAEQGPINT
jgi:CDGSH-type Zn-finger protein